MSKAPKRIWLSRHMDWDDVKKQSDEDFEYVRADLVDELTGALESIAIFGSDTLSGRADGGVDDRSWQREAVREMTKRARAALAKIKEEI